MIRPLALIAFALLAAAAPARAAAAQRCPPNSHAAAVAVPGNLRTAQCFCNRGFVSIDGVCVPVVRTPPPGSRPPDPAGRLVPPAR